MRLDKLLKTKDELDILEEGFKLSMAKCSLITGGILSKAKCQVPVYTKYLGELKKELSSADTPEKKIKLKKRIETVTYLLDSAKKRAKKDWRPDPNKKIF